MEMIKDYEVEGSWNNPKYNNRCRNCGAITELVPKEGHYNSKYWRLQRNDDLLLFCCPNGCSVKKAESKMRYFLQFSKYMIKNSYSYNYKLDYKKIKYFWLDTNGIMYPCEAGEHNQIACNYFDSSSMKLKKEDFIESMQENKNSAFLITENKINKRQMNVIMDWINENNFKIEKFIDKDELKYLGFSVYF